MWGELGGKKNCYPFLYSVIFLRCIMNTFEKKTHFPSQHNIFFFIKSRECRKKLWIVVAAAAFFQQRRCFLRKTENNNWAQKILRLRNSIAEEFVGFFFRKKHIQEELKSVTKKLPRDEYFKNDLKIETKIMKLIHLDIKKSCRVNKFCKLFQ